MHGEEAWGRRHVLKMCTCVHLGCGSRVTTPGWHCQLARLLSIAGTGHLLLADLLDWVRMGGPTGVAGGGGGGARRTCRQQQRGREGRRP